jgi:thiol:disulfide interchange protein DsbC
MIKKLLPLIAIVSLSLHAENKAESKADAIPLPESDAYRQEIKGNLEAKGQVKGIQEIPVGKLYFVEAEQGSYLVTSDGRFVFEGKLTDVWYRRTIKTLDDARAIERTPVSHIGFEPEEQLAHFIIGDSKKPRLGVAFVDPTTDYTTQFLKKITEKPLEGHWTVILMPLIGGNTAVDRSLRLWCAEDREAAKKDFIEGTNKSFSKLTKGCNDERIIMGMMLTDLFHIKSLPHLIREDGLKSEGYPPEFDKWFSQP